jgi:hypothetical protein
MPVDTSIYGGLLRRPQSLIGNMNDIAAGDVTRAQAEGLNLNLIGQRQDMEDQQRLRQLYAQPGFDPTKAESLSPIFAISPKAGMAAQKAQQDAQETQAKVGHLQAQTAQAEQATTASQFELGRKKLDTAMQIVTTARDPAMAHQLFQQAVQRGLMTPQEAAQKEQEVPTDPQGFQQWRDSSQMALVEADKRLTLAAQQAQQAETARHNQASEQNTRRGQDMVDARTRDALGKPFEVTGPDGAPTLVQQDKSGAITPVVGYSPKPTGKQIPTAANTAIITNGQNILKVQQALDLLDGKKVGSMEGDPSATGLKGYLPNGMLNRFDSKGVDTRAAISDIGSLVLHDRSGAAVTASEYPRLMPFIPLATDDKETAKKKLKRFLQVYQSESEALSNAYSAEAGYRVPPKAKKAPEGDIHAQADAILRGGN